MCCLLRVNILNGSIETLQIQRDTISNEFNTKSKVLNDAEKTLADEIFEINNKISSLTSK